MSTPTTFTNLRIWDGIAENYLEHADSLRIEGEKIVGLGTRLDMVDDATECDCTGLTVVPGLIDAHVHLTLDPNMVEIAQLFAASPDETLAAVKGRVSAMVRAGITTARDLGGGAWLELQIRDRINAGDLAGPRLLCAGQPITSVNGHACFWGGEAEDLSAALRVLERQVEKGVDLIKVMATGGYGTPGSIPDLAQFDEFTMRAIVGEARARGLYVAAHCHGTPGIRVAANAGVRTIEHCSWGNSEGRDFDYDAQTASLIASQPMWVSPTVSAGWIRNVTGAFEERVRGSFLRMREAGIRIIASTDGGIPGIPHDDLPRSLPALSHFAHLSCLETLKAATSECALALGLSEVTGRLAVGYSADILFVRGDPLANLAALAEPVRVVARGRTIL